MVSATQEQKESIGSNPPVKNEEQPPGKTCDALLFLTPELAGGSDKFSLMRKAYRVVKISVQIP